ncbi:Na(+)/H(+) antiporter subunit B [Salinicoccus halodurans]|uniref:Monovalent cation/H+ antiporter subunit B n=1 Tax=Salinicoccus halodurans TaxID=407035 RepID=A0A0F7HJQ3_9STAP|nr:Na(+)/H(+) antiporter subunit B [Salinicoccus halodurans]AKG73306.1 monovalent cation/H+ antiporter subunit B [Salinicoccus halodurans]SFK82623.1 multisubunit sodium/proton antiporter, MrpB subunit [Salinicoccus halodurans]
MKSTLKKAGYNKVQKQVHDVFLQFTAKVVFFIIILFAFKLFFAGHYTPGGGFVGGLLAAAAIILLLIAFDQKTVEKVIPIDFRLLIAVGLAFAAVLPTLSFFFGTPFFTHQHTYVNVPVFGEVALHSAVIFDIGVFLTVAGSALLMIKLIAEEDA